MSYSICLKGTSSSSRARRAGVSRSLPRACPSPTYNLSPIFDLALTGEPWPSPDVKEVEVVLFGQQTARPRGLRLLHRRVAKDTIADLDRALARCADPSMRAHFEALNPPNGWGRFDGAAEVLQTLRTLASGHPHHVWEVR